MLDRDLSEKFLQLVASSLESIINEHWLAKKELKSLAFSLKSVINLFQREIGGIKGTFLPIKKTLQKTSKFWANSKIR